jgi:hypothetical protein
MPEFLEGVWASGNRLSLAWAHRCPALSVNKRSKDRNVMVCFAMLKVLKVIYAYAPDERKNTRFPLSNQE